MSSLNHFSFLLGCYIFLLAPETQLYHFSNCLYSCSFSGLFSVMAWSGLCQILILSLPYLCHVSVSSQSGLVFVSGLSWSCHALVLVLSSQCFLHIQSYKFIIILSNNRFLTHCVPSCLTAQLSVICLSVCLSVCLRATAEYFE